MKQPLTLSACNADERAGSYTVISGKSYQLQINPSDFKHSRSICYNTKVPLGAPRSTLKYKAMGPETVSFSAVLDGTGVVPRLQGFNTPLEVADQIDAISEIIYNYDGEMHEPPYVQLLWGKLVFYGRLQTFKSDYLVFKPSGVPLRAKLDLEFLGSSSSQSTELAANKSSPDLSHVVEVRDGDTLPLLCLRIYGDSRYYTAVARHNGLAEFRRLMPGQRLHFPPLE
ncbi:CIS tube protein [Roseateles aquae]|nr:peptidoglycan-binding protein [Paucibacter sp. APW11]